MLSVLLFPLAIGSSAQLLPLTLARAGPEPIYVFNASPLVRSEISARGTPAALVSIATLRALEAIRERLPLRARTIRIIVIYNQIPEVDPFFVTPIDRRRATLFDLHFPGSVDRTIVDIWIAHARRGIVAAPIVRSELQNCPPSLL